MSRYTASGYVAQGYVEATFVGASLVSASATLSATGGKIHGSSANLFSNVGGLTWSEMGTWAEPIQATWGAGDFTVTGERLKGGRIVETSSFTVSATAVITLGGTVNISGVLNTNIDANAILAGLLTSPPSTFTLTASATAGILGQGAFTSTFTQTTNGGLLSVAEASISSNVSVNAVGSLIHQARTLPPPLEPKGVFSVQALGKRIRLGTGNFNSSFTLVADPDFTGVGASLKSSSFTVDAIGLRIRFGAGAFTGGFLAHGEASLTTSGSTLVVGRKISFDPFRMVAVSPETRINIVAQETRKIVVPSESRKLTVQHTVLVDEVGPIDRRTG